MSPVCGIFRIATINSIAALLALAVILYSLYRAELTTRNCGGKTVQTVETITTGTTGMAAQGWGGAALGDVTVCDGHRLSVTDIVNLDVCLVK